MIEKLYSVGSRFQFNEIVEFHVLKETEKTFVVCQNYNPVTKRCDNKTIIKKSEMYSNWTGHLCYSIEEAKAKRKEIFKNKILNKQNTIKQLNHDISYLEGMLKGFEEKDNV